MKIQNAHEATTFLKVESNKFHAFHLAARKWSTNIFGKLKRLKLIKHEVLIVQHIYVHLNENLPRCFL
jgi:hypothetical protein